MKKLALKPLPKECKGEEYSDRLQSILTGAGLSGIQFVGFSPDKYPENPGSRVVGFVVFASQEQRDAAITDNKANNALMTTEFQLEHRVVGSEQKDPERNLALDRLEKDTVAQATGKETTEQHAARRRVQRQGAWQGGGMIITDERGTVLQRGGEAALQ